MNTREQALVHTVSDRLVAFGQTLIDEGWRPELVVLTSDEITRIPGYKVALVVPIDSVPKVDEPSEGGGA